MIPRNLEIIDQRSSIMAAAEDAENNDNNAASGNQRPTANGNTNGNGGGGNKNRINDTNNQNDPRCRNLYLHGFRGENEKLATLMLRPVLNVGSDPTSDFKFI